jgi:hypothetical protein
MRKYVLFFILRNYTEGTELNRGLFQRPQTFSNS